MKKTVMLGFASSLFLSSAIHAAIENRFFVCHFDGDVWTKVDLPESEVSEHFALHDDAFPGWRTSISATDLDRNCKPANRGEETAE